MKEKKTTKKNIPSTEKSETFENHDISIERTAADAGNTIPAMRLFPIVGIGASAGGLAAIEAFFSAMPSAGSADPGMAFILVQHLAPDHKSILTDLVTRFTRMRVFTVEDGMTVEPDCVYIIPPNYDMAYLNGALQLLTPATPHGLRLPIDFFFNSLAQDLHERAICVILSGTGSDGTMGMRAVKSEGGLIIAQNPESAEYDGMPKSAIATGLVDLILPPAEIPARLISFTKNALGRMMRPMSDAAPDTGNALKKIFILLRTHTGHDFSQYKPNTINRRIERRMDILQVKTIEEYLLYTQHYPAELEELFLDILIGVTNFFRDPDAFSMLETQVIPNLFSVNPAGGLIRVWIPGCSTGEEAYSIAILLAEQMDILKTYFKVQIFATDIDNRAIAKARTGFYPVSIAADISEKRLARFFTRDLDRDGYFINQEIRDMLIISEQDVIKDPPFSKLNLISCRNLLIYMGSELQKKLIPLFHYTLIPGGYLFLGSSETVGEFADLFTSIDLKAKLYQRRDYVHGAHIPVMSGFLRYPKEKENPQWLAGEKIHTNRSMLRELTERLLLSQYNPIGALVNEHGDILYLHGRAGMFLEPVQGETGTNNILEMAREGLQRALTTSFHKAVTGRNPVTVPGLRVKTNGSYTIVNLTIKPVSSGNKSGTRSRSTAGRPVVSSNSAPAMFLVIMEEDQDKQKNSGKTGSTGRSTAAAKTKDEDALIAVLKQELQSKEEYLQTINEELETSNEEMQSINEELETSREEMQSINEELSTVNAELQTKVVDLSRANNDMNNLMAGTNIATIFVDLQLHILRFTPAVTKIIKLINTDKGRSLDSFEFNLVDYRRLIADIQTVLDGLVIKEIEVQAVSNEWYMVRIHPYRTLSNIIEGAVITFINITDMKKAQEAIRDSASMRLLAAVVHDANDAITTQDQHGNILTWNPAAERMYGFTEAEALTMNIRDRIPADHRENAMAVVKRLGMVEIVKPYRTQRLTKDGRVVDVWLTATSLVNDADEMYAIATTERIINTVTDDIDHE